MTHVPENHREYDAKFLRAASDGPSQDVLALQISSREEGYRNPWIIPWHMRPHLPATDKGTLPCVGDFTADAHTRLLATIESTLEHDKGASISMGDVLGAERLMTHIVHSIVQNSCAFHTDRVTEEQMRSAIRRDLMQVFHQTKSSFVAETPAHPFWKHGRAVRQSSGAIARFPSRKPTTTEKKVARWLAGPNASIKGPEGRIMDLLEEAQPYLLESEPGAVVRYATDTRTKLLALTNSPQTFDDARREECVGVIADAWNEILSDEKRKQLLGGVHDWDAPADQILAEEFPETVIEDPELFHQKRIILEQLSILESLKSFDGDQGEASHENLHKIFGVWEIAMIRHRLSLCDYPSLGLSFLATNACLADWQNFRANIE